MLKKSFVAALFSFVVFYFLAANMLVPLLQRSFESLKKELEEENEGNDKNGSDENETVNSDKEKK